MFAVLLVCAAPVLAAYLAYYVVRPQARTNYSELIAPPRPLPATLAVTDLQGHAVPPATLHGQWLLVVVSGGACDARCERYLWLQRQLHETLGKDKDRVDKLWLIDDGIAPQPRTLAAIGAASATSRTPAAPVAGAGPTSPQVLFAPRAGLATWLQPEPRAAIEDHLYIVDPQGDWMMRAPVDAEPTRLKRDVEKLLRASAGWDRPGR